jgi:hypothetical protein
MNIIRVRQKFQIENGSTVFAGDMTTMTVRAPGQTLNLIFALKIKTRRRVELVGCFVIVCC